MSLEQQFKELERRLETSQRRQRRIVCGLLLAAACCCLVGASFASRVQVEGSGGLVKVVDEGIVQRGMIVPYFGKELPNDRYVWADGKTDWPDEEWVPKHLQGQPVPNLYSFVVRGVQDLGKVGIAVEGMDLKGVSTSKAGAHHHKVSVDSFTGRVHGDGHRNHSPEQLAQSYNVQTAGGYNREHGLVLKGRNPNGSGGEGNHVHELKFEVDSTSAGEHDHSIDASKLVPSHVGVRFIIRIK